MMPRHYDRRKRGTRGGQYEVLDFFAEDPWAEPDLDALGNDADDEWYPGLWGPDDDATWGTDETLGPRNEEPYDDGGPSRRRRTRSRDRA